MCRNAQQHVDTGTDGSWALRVFLQNSGSTVRRAAVIRPFAKSGDADTFWI
jgi:hypothetical protein